MSEITKGGDARSAGVHGSHDKKAEKRHSTDGDDNSSAPPKKITMSLGSAKPTPLLGQKISFNLAASGDPKPKTLPSAPSKPVSKISAAPIKMALNTATKAKEPPPVVQKSLTAAKMFEDSDDSEEEEMPPEAKMRMKNIGRNTPTASGPNSYGKGKMGFTDRHKILEKQLKEEMEKVSGDNANKKK